MQRLVLSCAAILSFVGLATVSAKPVDVPWQAPNAGHRQVVEAQSDTPRQNGVVEFAVKAPADAALRVVDVAVPDKALPIFRDGAAVTVQVPGALAEPRLLAVYWSGREGFVPSPTLANKPVGGDDYATTVHGDAWDFNEGDQDGIRSWGDRPSHYGKITVKDGLLNVPVTGKDPYCIWGVMFGNPEDQPPGHAEGPGESIDSGRYQRLRMRVRQSCPSAEWSFFFTDEKGRYQAHSFTVHGTEFQTLSFDLPTLLPQFWDGRTMRAFRLDTTNFRPGATVQIDWIRIEPRDPVVVVGPAFTQGQVAARGATRRFDVLSPGTCSAGADVRFAVASRMRHGMAAMGAGTPFVCELRDEAGELVSRAADWAGGLKGKAAELTPNAGEKARTLRWTVGVQDDLGQPMAPLKDGKLQVRPAALDHYVLVPSRRFVPVDADRTVRVQVSGADRFGNSIPVRATKPKVAITGGGTAGLRTFKGVSTEIVATCGRQPLVPNTVRFTDENGIKGECAMQTIAFRQDKVALTPTGYITINGELFLPLGGFYANWPSGLPTANGKIARSVDLFPCGPKPYPHGFPWSAEVEQQVNTYLDLCQKNGVTALRLMLRNMDIVGRVDPVQLKATLHLFDLARPRGIRFNVALFEDYTKPPYVTEAIIDKICLPHYTPAELAALPPHRARFLVDKHIVSSAAARYHDPDAIQCQKDYLDELIPILAGREDVLCYEFENEMVRPPMSWCREIAAYIRTIDPHTPVLGNPGPHEWPEPWRWRDSTVDLFSYHPYNNGNQDVDHGAVIFMRSKWAAATEIPFYTGEGGINQNRWQKDIKKVPNEFSMRGIRDQIWLSMACGATGSLMWTADCEAEMAEFGKVLPALKAVGIDLKTLQRRQPRVVMTMPPDSNKANGNAYRLGYELLARGVDFDVRPEGDAKGYDVRVDGANPDLPPGLRAEFFFPEKGWQLAALVSATGDQALVYLRNVAGGIRNYGEKRACWLRTPAPAEAAINLLGGEWQQVRAFDLDTGQIRPVERKESRLVLPGATNHDMVIGFVRRKEF
jgi:hypothetical protein